jgi:hypothetical protein
VTTTARGKFWYYKKLNQMLQDRSGDGRPRIPEEHDELLQVLVREHGPAGRRDIAPQLRRRPPRGEARR